MEATTFLVFIASLLSSAKANACDEHSWEEVQGQQRRCLEDRGYFLHEMFKVVEEDISSKTLFGDSNECSFLGEVEDCSWSLYLCEDSHALEISLLLSKQLPKNWETVYQSCQLERTPSGARSKRSARKRGSSSSSRSRGSRIRSGIKRVTSTLRRGSGSSSSGGSRGGGSLTRLLGGKKSGGAVRPGIASAAAGAARKKNKRKWLKRAGGIAVAGLAAYGTYKLAKGMSKALRREYDDDECWEYSFLKDEYECECDDCNIYTGSANAVASASFALTVAAAIVSSYMTRVQLL